MYFVSERGWLLSEPCVSQPPALATRLVPVTLFVALVRYRDKQQCLLGCCNQALDFMGFWFVPDVRELSFGAAAFATQRHASACLLHVDPKGWSRGRVGAAGGSPPAIREG